MNQLMFRCRTSLVAGLVAKALVEYEVPEIPGTVTTFAGRVEEISPSLMIEDLSYISNNPGRRRNRRATLKATLTGLKAAELRYVIGRAQAGWLLQPLGGRFAKLLHDAAPLAAMPFNRQKAICIDAATWDASGLVADLTEPILRSRGTVQSMLAHTENATNLPGVADFVVRAVVGFATVEEAVAAELMIAAVPFRDRKVTRLYEDPAQSVPMPRIAA